jgi:hypothetical protein
MTDLRWPILQWTENLPPSQEYCDPIEERWYNHCVAYTPFGRFLVCWRTAKPHIFCIRETPWSALAVETYDSLEAAKAACQQAMNDRLEQWVCAPSPLAEREIEDTDYTLTIGVNLDFSSESLAELCNSLLATVKPDGGYKKSAKDNPVRHQLVDGVWMEPRHGCHSLQITLDAIKEEITEVITNWINTSTVTTCKPTTND